MQHCFTVAAFFAICCTMIAMGTPLHHDQYKAVSDYDTLDNSAPSQHQEGGRLQKGQMKTSDISFIKDILQAKGANEALQNANAANNNQGQVDVLNAALVDGRLGWYIIYLIIYILLHFITVILVFKR
ncbi:hypothetical protein BDA99DRAFT_539138 [Phascolomyces articulosus]|uniref:Uncharacterized protein n=1 Tax=Phascolomyces articulosus TaxID=60185 RepID=A0AAD5JX03_9FUNG|nr:hypothetical protein BDA99DRAFT_539138 [Phascolomyces articulosus]